MTLPFVSAAPVFGAVSLGNFSSDVAVQFTALRRRGRQSAIGGPRARFSLEAVTRREFPPEFPSSVDRPRPFVVNTAGPRLVSPLLLREETIR